MGSILGLDSPIINFMGKVADLLILNFLAIICSLPVFTIGASWTAMYYVTMRMVKKEEGYIIKDFFHSFKQNFKQATIIWLFVLMLIVLIVGDVFIYRAISATIPRALIVLFAVCVYLALGTVIYVFPILSRYHNTVKGTVKNAFFMSIVKFPYTFVFALLIIFPLFLLMVAETIGPIIIALGFSGPAYIISIMLVPIFRKIEGPEEKEETDEPGELPELTDDSEENETPEEAEKEEVPEEV